jgi:hypothetical protein
MYKINVAERYGRNWNDTEDAYKFLFRIKDDDFFRIQKAASKIKSQFPSPEYQVTCHVAPTYSCEVEDDFKTEVNNDDNDEYPY